MRPIRLEVDGFTCYRDSQVLDFYQEMEAADIPAGSTRAMRLFS